PSATRELDHVFSRCGDIVVIDRGGDDYAIGGFDGSTEFLRAWPAVALIRITERQLHFADVDPITIHFLLLPVRKPFLTHSAAVAVRVAAGADHKMLWHRFAGESLRKAGMQEGQRNLLRIPPFLISLAILCSLVRNDVVPLVGGRAGDEGDNRLGVAHVEYFMRHAGLDVNEIASFVFDHLFQAVPKFV